MDDPAVGKIVIVGGGTPCWMTAAGLTRGVQHIEATIVETSVRPHDGFVSALALGDGRRIVSLLPGLGAIPQRHDPMVDLVDEPGLRTHFRRLRDTIERTVGAMQDHAACLQRVLAQPLH